MVELIGFLIVVLAVIVLRRLLGIRRGRWVTTLVAVLLGEVGAALVIKAVYGNISSDRRVGVVLLAWALVVVFAMIVVVLVEVLSPGRARPRHRFPHPLEGLRRLYRRTRRYVQVARIVVRRRLYGAPGDQAAGPRRLRAALEDAGGLFVKLGQALADQPQLVGPAMAAELAGLQDEAVPADLDAARAVITEDLGPWNEVFAEMSSTPLGAASIAQTYLARLHDGREVVVKVQRPDVADSVQCDLDILHRLADRLDRRTTWARSMGLKELVAGFDERTREELDFRIEGANATAALRSLDAGDPVRVPQVIDTFTTARVLVEERAEGRAVGSPDAFAGWAGERRGALADGFLLFTMRRMLSGEPFHADLHPGNVFLRPDGLLELIDFGSVGALDPYERSGLIDMLLGVQREDPALLRQGLFRIGTPTRRIDEDALDRELARLLASGKQHGGAMNGQLFDQVLMVLRDFGILLPRSSATLFRALVTLLGTLRVIAPGYDITAAAGRVGAELSNEDGAPANLSDLVSKTALNNALVLRRLPQQVDALARSLLHGDLRTRVSLLSEPEDVRVARGMVNRLVLGIIASALALAAAIMLSAGGAPTVSGFRLVNLVGAVLLFFSVLLLLRLVVQILRDRE
ncbi:MAG TPA: AarF/UbiB family protein [Actinomycetota bacterium]|jgi:ubiquinone biosynthesis protein